MQRKDIDYFVPKNGQKLNVQTERVEPGRGHTNSTIQYSVSASGQTKQTHRVTYLRHGTLNVTRSSSSVRLLQPDLGLFSARSQLKRSAYRRHICTASRWETATREWITMWSTAAAACCRRTKLSNVFLLRNLQNEKREK